jgi:serpin B
MQALLELKIIILSSLGSFDEDTCLVLVNAIFFKGAWAKTFDEEETPERDFFTNNTQKTKVPFMTQTRKISYAKLDDFDAQLLVLDYKVNLGPKLTPTK